MMTGDMIACHGDGEVEERRRFFFYFFFAEPIVKVCYGP